MARTWDTVSTYETASAFTTARSYSHTVGGGSNRGIFQGISTEDFSTGGGGQTPSSVAYGGNALTLDGIVTDASIQTAAIYSGQDSVCGTAGAHNMVITYAGEVDRIVCFTASCDNIKQQVKEASGSTASGSGSPKTSNITTLTDQALIIAMVGNDTGAGVTVGWNVSDAEIGDVGNAGVGGAMNRYEKATAGAQAVTATFSGGSPTRTGIVSFAYETINSSAPTVTNISNQTGTMGTQKSVACTIADADSDIARCDVSTNGDCLITLTASGAATVTNNGTAAPYVTGSSADVIATLGNGIKLDRAFTWTDETIAPVWTVAETVTVLVTDALSATGNDTFTMTWTVATGDGTISMNLVNATIAGMNAETALAYLIPETDFTGTTYLYGLLTDDNGNTNEVIVEVGISEPLDPTIQISPLSVKSSSSFSQVFTVTLLNNVLTDISDAASIGAAITLGGLFSGLSHDQIAKLNSRQFSIRLYGNLATTSSFGSISLDESEVESA